MTGKDDWDKLSGQEQSNVQVGVTDMTNRISEVMHDAFGFSRIRAPGQKSNFEDHDLNDMIDIVENTNPADLEGAGEALWKAQKAISDAATELRGHLTAAEDDWKGEAGKAFQIWGKGLAGHADALADYAKAAGVQITSASTRAWHPFAAPCRPGTAVSFGSRSPTSRWLRGSRPTTSTPRLRRLRVIAKRPSTR